MHEKPPSHICNSSTQIFLILIENVSLFDTIMFSGVVQTMSVHLIYAFLQNRHRFIELKNELVVARGKE